MLICTSCFRELLRTNAKTNFLTWRFFLFGSYVMLLDLVEYSCMLETFSLRAFRKVGIVPSESSRYMYNLINNFRKVRLIKHCNVSSTVRPSVTGIWGGPMIILLPETIMSTCRLNQIFNAFLGTML